MWVVLLGFWILPSLFGIIGLQIVPSALNPGISLLELSLSQLLVWFAWALWTPLIILVSERVPFERGRLRRSVSAHLVMSLVVICAQILVTAYVSQAFGLSMKRGLESTLTIGFRGSGDLFVVIYWAIVGAHAALRWYEEWHAQGLVSAQLERDLSAAQLTTLRSQLNPHFLFNALNSVVTLIPRDQDGDTRMVVRLADLLRATLGMAEQQEIVLGRELETVRNYLDIELVRFPDRLAVRWEIEPATQSALVPAFALQPLVENAIVHGVSRRSGPAICRRVPLLPGSRRGGLRERSGHLAHQAQGLHRLCQITVAPRLARLLSVAWQRVRRKGEDQDVPRIRIVLQRSRGRPTVDIRHPDVHQDEGRSRGARQMQGVSARRCLDHPVAGVPEHRCRDDAVVLVVFGNEDEGGVIARGRSRYGHRKGFGSQWVGGQSRLQGRTGTRIYAAGRSSVIKRSNGSGRAVTSPPIARASTLACGKDSAWREADGRLLLATRENGSNTASAASSAIPSPADWTVTVHFPWPPSADTRTVVPAALSTASSSSSCRSAGRASASARTRRAPSCGITIAIPRSRARGDSSRCTRFNASSRSTDSRASGTSPASASANDMNALSNDTMSCWLCRMRPSPSTCAGVTGPCTPSSSSSA